MQIQDHTREQAQPVSTGQQLYLLVGFVIFITGFFCLAYALLASYLLPFSNSMLIIALSGVFAAYLGRKILRRNRKEITL
jgi:drug/metabolite transporter (DMT)-like permease